MWSGQVIGKDGQCCRQCSTAAKPSIWALFYPIHPDIGAQFMARSLVGETAPCDVPRAGLVAMPPSRIVVPASEHRYR
jgi:hypothetical protein